MLSMSAERLKFNLFEALDKDTESKEKLNWEGSLTEYIEKVAENPRIARSANSFVYDSVESRPDFFTSGANALFGADKQIAELKAIMKARAAGLPEGRKIILLLGPPGGGKSTLVNGMKKGIESYSKTDEGQAYAIAGCKMNDEPLLLIPEDMRKVIGDRLGVHIEGDLCPHCHMKYGGKTLKELVNDKSGELRIKRLIYSEKDRRGIGTFKPSDPKSQDISELIGEVNIAKLGTYGTGADPNAYLFNGEVNVANRGMLENVELLKVKKEFMNVYLDLTQDKNLKIPRYANIYVDEVLMAHTNLTEYNRFMHDKENEGMHDRIVVVKFPYNLVASEEEKIYKKHIGESKWIRESGMHINPHSFRTAANFAVMSRYEQSKKANIDAMKKLKIYDGQEDPGEKEELMKEFPNEGMTGLISPRYVLHALSLAVIKEGTECLTPFEVLRALRDNIESHASTKELKPEEKEKLKNYLAMARTEYNEKVKKEVQEAYLFAYEDQAKVMAKNYLDFVDAILNKRKIIDEDTDEEVDLKDLEERLARPIEEIIGITNAGKTEFRNEISHRALSKNRQNEQFDYRQHPRLKEAIDKTLFAKLQNVIISTTSTKVPDEDQSKHIHEAQQRLIDEKGYCQHCAQETIHYVGKLLRKKEK